MSEYKKMDPEIKKQWLKALRSRKYKQTQNVLCSVSENGKESFCCLGVLADIAGGDHGYWEFAKTSEYDETDQYWFVAFDGEQWDMNLPDLFQSFVGLDIDAIDTLINMNDHEKKKFYQIANWIERNL